MAFFHADFEVKEANGSCEVKAARRGNYVAFFSSSPDGFSDDNELGTFEESIVFPAPLPETRTYYHIFDDKGRYYVAARRDIEVENLANLRELGGYNTADGRSFVKHGKLFRSGRLCDLKPDGQRALQRLGIKYVLDFRSPGETACAEDRPVPGAVMKTVPALKHADDNPSGYFVMEEFLHLPLEKRLQVRDVTLKYYNEMPFDNEAYREMFALLLEGKAPFLCHCSAGKDRTGVACALLLLALGVPEETAVYDYMISKLLREETDASIKERYRALLSDDDSLSAYDIILSVRETSIRYSLDRIRERYKTFEEYFEAELGLGEAQLAQLRKMYLTEH